MIVKHKSKLAAKETVILAKATLESLTIAEPVTTVVTTMTTVSEEITSAAAAEAAVGRAVIVAEGTMKPVQDTLATTIFGQSTQHKETNIAERVKTANDLLSKDVIYTYWKDYGQFRDTTTCMTGHYANSVYTGAKEFLCYDTPHVIDQKMKAIMLQGMNEFSTKFKKYEGFSIRQPESTLLAITAFISKLLVLPMLMDIWDV